jgi:ankyrin repeat protein
LPSHNLAGSITRFVARASTAINSAQVNAQNNQDFTPLMLAILRKNYPATKLLIIHGANITVRNKQSKTAWKVALETNNQKIVNCL